MKTIRGHPSTARPFVVSKLPLRPLAAANARWWWRDDIDLVVVALRFVWPPKTSNGMIMITQSPSNKSSEPDQWSYCHTLAYSNGFGKDWSVCGERRITAITYRDKKSNISVVGLGITRYNGFCLFVGWIVCRFLGWDVGIKLISNSETWVAESLTITICIMVEMDSHLMLGCHSHEKVCSRSAAEHSGVLLLMAAGIPRTTLDRGCCHFYGTGAVWRCFHVGCWEKSELVDVGFSFIDSLCYGDPLSLQNAPARPRVIKARLRIGKTNYSKCPILIERRCWWFIL